MKRSLFLIFLFVGTAFCLPSHAVHAQLFGFGGYVVAAEPLTCPTPAWLINYAPLEPELYPWVFHSLVFAAGPSIPYAYQEFITLPTPTAWEMGNFTPGAADEYGIGAEPTCAPVPNDGLIFEVGSSFPGFTPF